MVKIEWCMEARNGIELVEPNANVAQAYILKAEESLESMRKVTSPDWKVPIAYYTMYYSVYALLVRAGVKCEIHPCTIEFAKHFLRQYFSRRELDMLEDSMNARIDMQYYVNRKVSDKICSSIEEAAPEFIVKCKSVLARITEKDINEIRNSVKERIN